MANRYATSYWCFLRTNKQLRTAVEYKLNTSGKTLTELGRECGVHSYRISSWLNGGHKPPSQAQLLKLCNYLGISVDLKIEFFDKDLG